MATDAPTDQTEPTATDAPSLDEILTHLDETDTLVVRARASLEATLGDLKLTAAEEAALSAELDQLRALTQKLDDSTVEIAAFGMVSRGKSSVLNALLGEEVFQAGSTHGTTTDRAASRWESVQPSGANWSKARLILVDTPGIDEVGGEAREALARDVARHADLLLFVVSSDMTAPRIRRPAPRSARPRSRLSSSSTRSTATPTPTAT